MTDVAQGKRTVSDDEIIEFMRSKPDPAFTTPELADQFGMTETGIRNRLNDLAERGLVERKKPAPRTLVWWPATPKDHPAFSE